MFAAPPEKELEWADQGVEGSYRFLNRVWRIVEKYQSILDGIKPYSRSHAELKSDTCKKLRTKTHETIQKVARSFKEGYHFNTCISAIMEHVNEIYAYPADLGSDENKSILREAIECTLILLQPFTPHISEELWEKIGGKTSLSYVSFPPVDPDALVKDVIPFIIQINGKLRGKLEVAVSMNKDQVIELAQNEPKVAGYLEGKSIVKTIFVPKRLINFVIK